MKHFHILLEMKLVYNYMYHVQYNFFLRLLKILKIYYTSNYK